MRVSPHHERAGRARRRRPRSKKPSGCARAAAVDARARIACSIEVAAAVVLLQGQDERDQRQRHHRAVVDLAARRAASRRQRQRLGVQLAPGAAEEPPDDGRDDRPAAGSAAAHLTAGSSSQLIVASVSARRGETIIYSAVSAEDDKGGGRPTSPIDGTHRSSASSSRRTTASSPASSSAWPGWSRRRSGSTGSRRSPSQQARSEQAIAQTKAENDWRIARAEILSKNLNVLSAQGPGSADQRFGVLLSLTRGAIIDPELAVSYALELGKDNADLHAQRCWRRPARRTTSSWRRRSS